jgi:hypothetical protein
MGKVFTGKVFSCKLFTRFSALPFDSAEGALVEPPGRQRGSAFAGVLAVFTIVNKIMRKVETKACEINKNKWSRRR